MLRITGHACASALAWPVASGRASIIRLRKSDRRSHHAARALRHQPAWTV